MKSSGSLVFALLVFCSSAFAQVGSSQSSTPQGAEPNSPPSKPPTYTPEQLFGTPAPPPATNNSITDRSLVPQQVPTTPRVEASAPATRPSPCPTSQPPPPTSHPGVSASQFKRAGVSAEAFTRPGVSTEQLDALRPGGRSNPCAPPRTIILYPEPVAPSPRIPQSSPEPSR
jgi:hypothetical protein